eukprot:gene6625-4616_t
MDEQDVAITLNAYARMGQQPREMLLAVIGQRAQEVAEYMDAQAVANTLNAYAKLGLQPGMSLLTSLGQRAK